MAPPGNRTGHNLKEKIMNKIYAIAATLALFGAPVFADDFDATTYTLVAHSGILDVSVDGGQDGISNFAAGLTGLAHNLGAVSADVRGELAYALDTDALSVRGEYNAAYETVVTLYGSAAIQYTTAETDLKGGDWMFEPTAGVSYAFNDGVSVYGEVSYAWDVGSSWNRLGGAVEIGAPITVTDTFSITPSIGRAFDTADASWNANITAAVRF
jgi:hypothetical protein